MVLVLVFINAQWAAEGNLSHKCSSYGLLRPHSVSITEFGAVGDGATLNTNAFQNAMFYLNSFTDKGGAKLFVPAGRWLTGSFDLISHLTLWLDKDAVILGSTVTHFDNWLPWNSIVNVEDAFVPFLRLDYICLMIWLDSSWIGYLLLGLKLRTLFLRGKNWEHHVLILKSKISCW